MIVKAIFDAILGLFKVVFNLLPDVPSFPQTLLESLDTVFDTIFGHLEVYL